MTEYERTSTETRTTDPYPATGSGRAVHHEREVVETGPSTGEVLRRAVALLFGVLQGLLILRIILLLLVANQDNTIVALILNVTDPFVAPFLGMFQLNEVSANGSQLDIAAIVALVGWTLIEFLILALLSLGARRGEAKTV